MQCDDIARTEWVDYLVRNMYVHTYIYLEDQKGGGYTDVAGRDLFCVGSS